MRCSPSKRNRSNSDERGNPHVPRKKASQNSITRKKMVVRYSAYLPLQFVCIPSELSPGGTRLNSCPSSAIKPEDKCRPGTARRDLWTRCVECLNPLDMWCTLVIQFFISHAGPAHEADEKGALDALFLPRLICRNCHPLSTGDSPYPLLPAIFQTLDVRMNGLFRSYLHQNTSVPKCRKKVCAACLRPRKERRNRKRRKGKGQWIFCSSACKKWWDEEFVHLHATLESPLESVAPTYGTVPDYHNYLAGLVSFLRRSKFNVNAALSEAFVCAAVGCSCALLVVNDKDSIPREKFSCERCDRAHYCSENHREMDRMRHRNSCVAWEEVWNPCILREVHQDISIVKQ